MPVASASDDTTSQSSTVSRSILILDNSLRRLLWLYSVLLISGGALGTASLHVNGRGQKVLFALSVGISLIPGIAFTYILVLGLAIPLLFIKELIVELLFLPWSSTKKSRPSRDLDPERAPLLGDGAAAPAGRFKTPAVEQYHAIDLAAIDLRNLSGGARVQDLPTVIVQFPLSDITHAAVLSWRWDFAHDVKSDASANLACAIHYAKSVNIQYLFIDIVSLDQSLPAEDLMKQVASFGSLYTTLPVIAAYDDPRLDFDSIMRRAWIFSELQLMSRNPYTIVYVGHCSQGIYVGGSVSQWLLNRVLRSQISSTNFARQLCTVWSSSLMVPIFEILGNNNSMADIHDFKYILPQIADVIVAAERLGRNDYLLIVALMAASTSSGGRKAYEDGEIVALNPDFIKAKYSALRVQYYGKSELNPWDDIRHFRHHYIEVYLRDRPGYTGARLATFRHSPTRPNTLEATPDYWLTLTSRMRREILSMFGIDDEAWSRQHQHISPQRTFRDRHLAAANAYIEVVEVSLGPVRESQKVYRHQFPRDLLG